MSFQRGILVRGLSRLTLAVAMIVTFGATGQGARAQEEMGTVVLVPSEGRGMVLTDGGGYTLYTWAGDEPGVSNCYDACANAWPAYMAWDVMGSPDVPGTLGLIDRGDGTWQVALDDWPLYYFARDASPGDVNGEGSMGFGAQWFIYVLVAPEPAPATIAEPAPVPAAEIPAPAPAASAPEQTVPATTAPAAAVPAPAPPGVAGPGLLPPGFIPNGYAQTLTVVAPPNGIVNLSWVPNPAAQAYRIYGTQASQPTNLTVVQNVTQAIGELATTGMVTGLTPGVSYLIQIRAVEPNGTELAAPATVLAGGPPPSLPAPSAIGAATGLAILSSSPTTVTVSWTPILGARSYQVMQSGTPIGPFAPSAMGQTTNNGATITGLQPNTTYYFQLMAMDGLGNQSPMSNTVSASTMAAGAASTGLSVGGLTATTATLSWTPVPGAAFYQIGQALSPNGPFASANLMSPTSTSVTVTGLTPGVTYYFQVSALDAAGNQILATPAAAAATLSTGGPLGGATVAAPANLVASATTGSTVTLSWAASQGATSYAILQSSNPNGPFFQATTASMSGTGATIGGLVPNTTYYFQIVALDPSGRQSIASNTTTAMTTSALASPKP